MSETPTRLEITPRIIDLGDRVIQLSNVASAAIATVHPLRGTAKLALMAAGGLGLAELLRNQIWSSGKDAPLFSAVAALALVALIAGAGLFLYRKRLLVISTSDGQTAWVRSGDADFLRLVLEAIRKAMTSTDPDFRANVDLSAMAISGSAIAVGGSAGPALSAGSADEGSWADQGPEPTLPHVMNGAGADTVHPPRLEEANGSTSDKARSSFAEAMLREVRTAEATAPATPPRSTGRAELEEIILLIDRASLPHKAELNALLDPVRDHLTGGRTRRSDAVHNWRLFHDYAQKYLTDVNGLADGCRRVDAALR